MILKKRGRWHFYLVSTDFDVYPVHNWYGTGFHSGVLRLLTGIQRTKLFIINLPSPRMTDITVERDEKLKIIPHWINTIQQLIIT